MNIDISVIPPKPTPIKIFRVVVDRKIIQVNSYQKACQIAGELFKESKEPVIEIMYLKQFSGTS